MRHTKNNCSGENLCALLKGTDDGREKVIIRWIYDHDSDAWDSVGVSVSIKGKVVLYVPPEDDLPYEAITDKILGVLADKKYNIYYDTQDVLFEDIENLNNGNQNFN